ncbi:MAG: hypothetical protein LBE22_01655 [Azoarcus sp.]|nr:hypothetical protein [Azoarcus sp.]
MMFSIFRKVFFWISAICGSLMLMWFVLFRWNFVPYPTDSGYGPFVCYSPNHEYFIKRYQTPFEAIQDQLYADGYAILYDKTGKKIYEGKTHIGNDNPYWFDDSVAFFGSSDEWYYKLPSSPGAHPETHKGCFDEKSDYVAPPLPSLPRREFIVRGVEPLIKTKAPYQLQFLVEDQHSVPFPSFKYIIYRADGSQQEGETDENGRTTVIESTQDEVIRIYISPFQLEENFTRPEKLEAWCSQSPDGCIRVEDQTFTANTISQPPAKAR